MHVLQPRIEFGVDEEDARQRGGVVQPLRAEGEREREEGKGEVRKAGRKEGRQTCTHTDRHRSVRVREF